MTDKEPIVKTHKKNTKQEIAKHIAELEGILSIKPKNETLKELITYWQNRYELAPIEDNITFCNRPKHHQEIINCWMNDYEDQLKIKNQLT